MSTTTEFTSELFYETSSTNLKKNVIFSPTSLQTALALAYCGADGKTASEMVTGLKLGTNDHKSILAKFSTLMSNAEKSTMLKIANKMFANQQYVFKPSFNEIAKTVFASEVENLDFSKSAETIAKINDWVENKTNNKIQNLMTDGSVQPETAMILVNAIYFKGQWLKPFTAECTSKREFWNHGTETVEVDTMIDDDRFAYGESVELDSKILEMDYKNSDLSMMLILPNEKNGLSSLIEKLKNQNLIALSNSLKVQSTDVRIPKFKVEFDLKFNSILEKMGMTTMFTDEANFSKLSDAPVKISEVVHKAFIDVNEAGSEAAASTYLKIVPMCLNLDQKRFEANHPFIYLIKDKHNVYFMGHIVEIH